MEDIREVLEMHIPTHELMNSVQGSGPFVILTTDGDLKTAHFWRYKTVAPKFEENCRYPNRYTMDEVKYIFLKK